MYQQYFAKKKQKDAQSESDSADNQISDEDFNGKAPSSRRNAAAMDNKSSSNSLKPITIRSHNTLSYYVLTVQALLGEWVHR